MQPPHQKELGDELSAHQDRHEVVGCEVVVYDDEDTFTSPRSMGWLRPHYTPPIHRSMLCLASTLERVRRRLLRSDRSWVGRSAIGAFGRAGCEAVFATWDDGVA